MFAVAAAPLFVVLQSQSSLSLLTRTEAVFVLPKKLTFLICSLQIIAAVIAVILEVNKLLSKPVFPKLFKLATL